MIRPMKLTCTRTLARVALRARAPFVTRRMRVEYASNTLDFDHVATMALNRIERPSSDIKTIICRKLRTAIVRRTNHNGAAAKHARYLAACALPDYALRALENVRRNFSIAIMRYNNRVRRETWH